MDERDWLRSLFCSSRLRFRGDWRFSLEPSADGDFGNQIGSGRWVRGVRGRLGGCPYVYN
jgi:hypothetical protein